MRVSVVCLIDDSEEMLCDDNSKLKRNARSSCLCNRLWWRNVCVMIILNWREMRVSVFCVLDGEESCVMIILNWREMRVSFVCVIDEGEEMLCDDNSKLKRNARYRCLCDWRWWRNVLWW